jgi:hypothetical protein
MKKIITILLVIISTKGYTQEYPALYEKMDSIAEKSVFGHVYRILDMCNFEYNQLDAVLIKEEREILATMKLDSLGKFKVLQINDANREIANNINDWLLKAPSLPLEKFKDADKLSYFSMKFDLTKKNYEKSNYNEIITIKNANTDIKRISELDIYPSYGNKPEKFTNKEKSKDNLNQHIAKFIKKGFKYPEFALENNIQGRIQTAFIINKEGKIRTIISCHAHPILQQEAISIVRSFPTFNPGIKNSKPVNVGYMFPLNFKLQ